jgi:prefoldin subunit 5
MARAAGTIQEEQHKTQTLRARLQELAPQANELREVRQTLSGLEAEKTTLVAELRRLEGAQSGRSDNSTLDDWI